MTLFVDFLLPRKPVSHQAKNKDNLTDWKEYVYSRAHMAWAGTPIHGVALKFTMVILAESSDDGDINNFVKPVQDALNSLIYGDDELVMDVSAHKRVLSDPIAIDGLPRELSLAIIEGSPCVYVAISKSRELFEELK